MGIKIDVHDPYAKKFDSLDIKIKKIMPKSSNYDAIVLAVNHKYYNNFNFLKWMDKVENIFLDTTNSLTEKIYKKMLENGVKVLITGRGDLY